MSGTMGGVTDPAELWDFDDPAGSEQRFREAAVEDDSALMMTQVARALGLQERYDEAHAVLDEVQAHPLLYPENQVRIYLERGRLFRATGQSEEAAQQFDIAAGLAEMAGAEALHIDALHMQAIMAAPYEGVLLSELALARAAGARDPRARDWDASLLNNLGMMHVETQHPDRALQAFERALEARERIGVPADIRVARWMIGWTLRLLGRRDEALEIQRGLKAELDALGERDPHVEDELRKLGAE
jgi:tetratricopeptide (TPR) repeat protein